MSDVEKRSGFGCVTLLAVYLSGAVPGALLGFFLGGIHAGDKHQRSRFGEKAKAIEAAIQNDPDFKTLRIGLASPYEEPHLHGAVPTEASKKRLHEVLTRAVGETGARAAEEMVTVEARQSSR